MKTSFMAYLVTGPAYIGKFDFCLERAAEALEVEENQLQAHPDLTIIRANQDEKGKLRAETVRETLSMLRTPPVRAKTRVVVIDGIDTLSSAGQNALLKSIEEPAVPTEFFLIAQSFERVLQTVQSRCVHVPRAFISHVQWSQEVQTFFNAQSSAVQQYLDGRPQLAKKMMSNKRESAKIEKEVAEIDLLLHGNLGARLAGVRVIAKKVDHAKLAQFLDDALLVAHRAHEPIATQRAIAQARAMTVRNLNKTFILDSIIFSTL